MPKRGSAESADHSPVPWLVADGDDTLVAVLVVPRSSRTQIDGEHDGLLRVRVAAPPVEGAANTALLEHLARRCKLPRRAVTLESGDASRRKRVRLAGFSPSQALTALR